MLTGPQIQARAMITEQEQRVLGQILQANLPCRFSDCDTTQIVPAPLVGQHNQDIPSRLGYSAGKIDLLVKDGVLYPEEAVAGLAKH